MFKADQALALPSGTRKVKGARTEQRGIKELKGAGRPVNKTLMS